MPPRRSAPPFLKRNVKKAMKYADKPSHWTRRNNLYTMKSLKKNTRAKAKPVVYVPVERNLRKYRAPRMVPIKSTIRYLSRRNQHQYKANQWQRANNPQKEYKMAKRIQKMVRFQQKKKRERMSPGFYAMYDAAYS